VRVFSFLINGLEISITLEPIRIWFVLPATGALYLAPETFKERTTDGTDNTDLAAAHHRHCRHRPRMAIFTRLGLPPDRRRWAVARDLFTFDALWPRLVKNNKTVGTKKKSNSLSNQTSINDVKIQESETKC
jgi:hypothetical protein